MISRHGQGTAKLEEATNYIGHLNSDTFPKLEAIPGFIRASILKRATDNGIEFLIVTVWDSIEAVQRFAGANPVLQSFPKQFRQ
jgi:heme-degrading monooxygenase HmoA